MSKHAADKHGTEDTAGRLKHYTEIEREEGGPSAQTRDLQTRPKSARDDAKRAKEFLRIERGKRA